MKSSWLKNVEKSERKEVELAFSSSALIRKRLQEVLADKDKTADVSAVNKDGYSCPNWAYKQADTQGYRRALKEIIDLLE